ncbi:STAS domain-containing protein [Hymenobacter busanensis]|nr:STAS domain-containing protein [Hymenobacter busanensis]QHJ06111.1 STAS domain-containing protein [Hymenobacter busanensis]
MNVFHEILPDHYLVLLADDQPAASAADSLERCLLQASRSRKPRVLVDCSRLQALATSHRDVLLRYHERLRRRGVQLVLVQLSHAVQRAFENLTEDARPLMLPDAPKSTSSAA